MTITGVIVTRRQALIALTSAASVATGILITDTRSAAAAVPDAPGTTTPTSSVRILETVSQRSYSQDWTTSFDVSVPAVLGLEDNSADASVIIQWDDRLFELSTTAFAVVGPESMQLTGESVGTNVVRFNVPAETSQLILQPSARMLYPNENVGSPTVSSVQLDDRESLPGQNEAMSASPWGAELRAAWASDSGYSYPSLVEVLSTGPGPIPAGTEIVVETFKAVADLTTESASGETVSTDVARVNQFRELVTAIDTDTPAGDTFTLLLAPDRTAADTGRASIAQVGRIYLRAATANSEGMRSTGKYSVAAITSSGTELSSNQPVQKA